MKAKLMKIFSVIMIIIVVVGGYWFFHRYEVSTDNAVIEGRNVVISPKSFGKLAKGEELEKKMNLVLTNNGWQGHIRKGGF